MGVSENDSHFSVDRTANGELDLYLAPTTGGAVTIATTITVPLSNCTSCFAPRSAPAAFENGRPFTSPIKRTPGMAVVLMAKLPRVAITVPGAGAPVAEPASGVAD